MADKIPLKANFTGADVTSLGEFAAGDTVPVASGGTGATTAAGARTNLGAAALAGSASQSFSMLNGTVAETLTTPEVNLTSAAAVTEPMIRITAAATGSGRTFIDINNTDTSVTSATSVALKAGATGTSTVFSHIATEYTGVPSWAGYGTAVNTEKGMQLIATSATGEIKFSTGGNTNYRLTIASTGAVTIPGTLSLTGASSTLGYGTGAGGTVTQATSKSTAVTLNKPCGQITMNNEALAAGAAVNFQVFNNLVTTTNFVVVGGVNDVGIDPLNYRVETSRSSGLGNFAIRVTNVSGGSLSEALIIEFALISVAIS